MRTAVIVASVMLLATPVMADDYPPGPGTTGTIAYEHGLATGVIDYPGDVDAFTVQTVVDGRSFAFVVTTHCRGKIVRFYDANMLLLRENWLGGTPDQEAIVEWRPRYAGIHYLTVTDIPPPEGYVCPEADSPAYEITSAESCSWGYMTVCRIRHDETKLGYLRAYGDRNWYKFTIQKHLQMMASVDGDGLVGTPVVTFRDARGVWLMDTLTAKVTYPPTYNGNCIVGKACLVLELCPGTYFAAVRDDDITQETPFTVNLAPIGYALPWPCP